MENFIVFCNVCIFRMFPRAYVELINSYQVLNKKRFSFIKHILVKKKGDNK